MRAIGLPGKAFVPLIVGFGCNVPTIMAARTLGSERDRILTVMMAPFMSCGARLAIYAVFVGAFFKTGGQNVIFLLYLSGILVAVLTGLLLRYTVLREDSTPMTTELPTYHAPHLSSVIRATWHRLKMFLKKAGRFIIPICMLIGALNAVSLDGKLLHGDANQDSILSSAGKLITPIFEPMGIKKENWPATVGLFTGLLAKEVVVGSLNTLYTQVGHLHQQQDKFNFWGGLKAAVYSVPQNLSGLPKALENPVLASAPLQNMGSGVYGVMHKYFDGAVGAFAYLLFILLYFPCVTTMAVMRREINKHWATFSMVWTTGVAYGIATGFYQLATIRQHELSSSMWVLGIASTFICVIFYLRYKTRATTSIRTRMSHA
jgi:ferrous iron transport protein B